MSETVNRYWALQTKADSEPSEDDDDDPHMDIDDRPVESEGEGSIASSDGEPSEDDDPYMYGDDQPSESEPSQSEPSESGDDINQPPEDSDDDSWKTNHDKVQELKLPKAHRITAPQVNEVSFTRRMGKLRERQLRQPESQQVRDDLKTVSLAKNSLTTAQNNY
ncbi:hypothetical protein BGZ65_009121 [Modicella reniformis]|uniref:Uncharacterized protein n=1 Tax=Modicella reniformis TaxID=1440133 RepID=A0A9P6ML61_9FUNG|nr:hypothetical protein BGZ65_009121 [Modicella reniformis]